MSSYLVVGLGNPGVGYRKNRHNLGFRVIDELARRRENSSSSDAVSFRKNNKSFVVEIEIANQRILLAKPLTYVNRSGEAVLSLLTRHLIPKENILVICDDLSLPLGKIRMRSKGSSGGHNGLQSIIESIGNDFARLRIGIGNPGSSAEWSDYVLQNFKPEEEEKLPEIINEAVEEVLNFIRR